MAEQRNCCVCGKPVSPPYNTIGGRVYCDQHFAAINKPHPGFWRASIIQILGMAAFALVVGLFANWIGGMTGTPLVVSGIFLALVPTLLWLIFFYRQDRLEPEPKTRILAVLLLAALLTDVLGVRIVYDWFDINAWATGDNLTWLLASILIGGFTYQAIIYASVRIVVYNTPEFDERMDGIVYGTIAGLGVATMLNLYYVIGNDGVSLGPGVVRVVTTTLAQASFGGILGYFMAEAKFVHKPVWWVPAGYAIAAMLNGLFSWLIGEVSSAGLEVEPWRSLLMGIVLALVVFFVLVMLMRRTTEVTLRPTARP